MTDQVETAGAVASSIDIPVVADAGAVQIGRAGSRAQRRTRGPAFTERHYGNIDRRADRLFHLDVGRPDHFAPPLGFAGDQLAAYKAQERQLEELERARAFSGAVIEAGQHAGAIRRGESIDVAGPTFLKGTRHRGI